MSKRSLEGSTVTACAQILGRNVILFEKELLLVRQLIINA